MIGQQGFTLVELIMAMALMGWLLILMTSGFIQVVRGYENSRSIRETQQVTRLALETVVSEVRNAKFAQINHANELCLTEDNLPSPNPVSGILFEQVGYPEHIVKYNITVPPNGSCATSNRVSAGQAITPSSPNQSIRVLTFQNSIIQPGVSGGTQSVQTLIRTTAVTDNELNLSGPAPICNPNPAVSTGFCNITEFHTSASLRSI